MFVTVHSNNPVLVNIAMAAAGMKKKVGILDADIFGPSIPKLMNLKGEPDLTEKGRRCTTGCVDE